MSDFGLSMIAYAGWIAAMALALAIEWARQSPQRMPKAGVSSAIAQPPSSSIQGGMA
jgi:hypothetical protein